MLYIAKQVVHHSKAVSGTSSWKIQGWQQEIWGASPRPKCGESREQCQLQPGRESELGAFLTAGNLLIPADPSSSKLVLPYVNTGVLKSLSSNDVKPTGLQELSLRHLALERL